MHATVARIRSASLEFPAPISSGMGAKTMYKMPTTRAPANVIKNAVAILSFIVAPSTRRHSAVTLALIQGVFEAQARDPVRCIVPSCVPGQPSPSRIGVDPGPRGTNDVDHPST